MTESRHQVIAAVCGLLSSDHLDEAAARLASAYPFTPPPAVARRNDEARALRVFMRDGFIDRYSGTRLVFPGTLRLISDRLPEVFPYHPNWKMSATHMAFWELSPTVDHIVPMARCGEDVEENRVTTSMTGVFQGRTLTRHVIVTVLDGPDSLERAVK